jgi:hypothetical protein
MGNLLAVVAIAAVSEALVGHAAAPVASRWKVTRFGGKDAMVARASGGRCTRPSR